MEKLSLIVGKGVVKIVEGGMLKWETTQLKDILLIIEILRWSVKTPSIVEQLNKAIARINKHRKSNIPLIIRNTKPFFACL